MINLDVCRCVGYQYADPRTSGLTDKFNVTILGSTCLMNQ